MLITLKLHLEELEIQERGRPIEVRRSVPTLGELAEAIQINRASLSAVANNHVRQLDLDLAARIIAELRRRGFKTGAADLLRYLPPDDEV